jgi:Ca2+-binding EF-hand superfamily protein
MSTAEKPKRSFMDREIARSAHLIHKLKAKDTTGRWAFYFVYVPEAKERFFLRAIEGDGIIDLAKFGRVIASCYGEEPTQEVKDLLKQKYDFEV